MAVEIDKNKSSKILQAVKERSNGDQIVNVDEETEKIIIFKLGDEFYSLFSGDVREILSLKKINFVPGSPDFILGIINVRGDLESVIDMNKILGLSWHKESKQNRIIVAEKGDFRSGILVGSVEDVLDVPKRSIKEPPSSVSELIKDFVIGAVEYKGATVTLLDIESIFCKKMTQ